MRLRQLLLICLILSLVKESNSVGWPEWRGPKGDGISTETRFPVNWSSDQNILWSSPLPAPGNSSPVVFGDRVYVTCANDDGTERSLMAFNRDNGELIWKQTKPHPEPDPTHPINPWCAPSPATDGQTVFVWNGSAGAKAYRAIDGSLIWERDLGDFVHQWGHSSSPRLFEDTVIIFGSPGPRVILTALDKATGETVWETNLSHLGSPPTELKGSFVTPFIWQNGDRPEMLIPLPNYLASFDPHSGEEIWRCHGLGNLTYTDAMVGEGMILAFSGYKGPSLGMRAPSPTEKGDLTDSHRIWINDAVEQRVGSGLILDGRYYVTGRKGPLKCGDIRTGEILWREDLREQVWSAINLAQGLLYVTDQAGITRIFRPGDRFELVSKNSLTKEDRGNSTIAFVDGQLFLRTHKNLYTIGSKE